MKQKKISYHLYYLIIGLFILLVGFFIGKFCFDSDVYFFLSEGRDIIKHGIPYDNHFSFIPNMKIIEQQWAWSVIVYSFYHVFGKFGLWILSVLHIVIFSTLCITYAKIKKVNKWTTALVLCAISFFLMPFLSARPAMITVNLMMAQLICMEMYLKNRKKRYILLLFPISILEANLHASLWMFHLLLMVAYIFPRVKLPFFKNLSFDSGKLIESQKTFNVKEIFASVMLLTLGGLCNPYGISAPLYIIKSSSPLLKTLGIQEMNNVPFLGFNGTGICFMITFAIFFRYLMQDKAEKCPYYALYIYLGFMYLGVYTIKSIPFAMMGIFILSCEVLKNKDTKNLHDQINKSVSHLKIPMIIMVGIVSMVIIPMVYSQISAPEQDLNYTPIKAVEYLDNHKVDKENARIYTEYGNGAYLSWHGYHGYIDARAEVWLPSITKNGNLLNEYYTLNHSYKIKDYKQFQDKYKFDYYLVNKGFGFDVYLLMDDSVEKVVESDSYYLFKAKTK